MPWPSLAVDARNYICDALVGYCNSTSGCRHSHLGSPTRRFAEIRGISVWPQAICDSLSSVPSQVANDGSALERLKELKGMLDLGLVTQVTYE